MPYLDRVPSPPGAGDLLSDPQVITTPYVNLRLSNKRSLRMSHHSTIGDSLFSSGNANAKFTSFEDRHKCNIFCKTFDIEKYTPMLMALMSTRKSSNGTAK